MISFDLEKSTEILQFTLDKHQVSAIYPCQVNLTFDVSGSFDDEHRNGYTQELLNRFVPFAMLFDKDKTLASYVFSRHCEQLDDINEQNYSDYVNRHIRRSGCYNGGTRYVPIFEKLIDDTKAEMKTVQVTRTEQVPVSNSFIGRIFGKKETREVVETQLIEGEKEKHLHIFVTDGEAQDETQAARLLDGLLSEHKNIYFLFISISNTPLQFLERTYGNNEYSSYINFTIPQLRNLKNVGDEELYDLILNNSMIQWMNRT